MGKRFEKNFLKEDIWMVNKDAKRKKSPPKTTTQPHSY